MYTCVYKYKCIYIYSYVCTDVTLTLKETMSLGGRNKRNWGDRGNVDASFMYKFLKFCLRKGNNHT